jgi:hypothetical protein
MAIKSFLKFVYDKTPESKIRNEATAPPYTCDGSIYKPYGVVRDKKTGKFSYVRRKV